MRRRLLAYGLLAMVFGLASGCEGKTKSPNEPSPKETGTPASESKPDSTERTVNVTNGDGYTETVVLDENGNPSAVGGDQ